MCKLDVLSAKAERSLPPVNVSVREGERERKREREGDRDRLREREKFSLIYTGTVMIVLYFDTCKPAYKAMVSPKKSSWNNISHDSDPCTPA